MFVDKLEIVDVQAIVARRLEDKLPEFLSLWLTSNLATGAE